MEKEMRLLVYWIFPLAIGLSLASGGCLKNRGPGTDEAKSFQALKAEKANPKTGLPETLDPDLIQGDDRKGYEIARQIPEVLAQMPCLCGCEALGHENLLDCFVDRHAVG